MISNKVENASERSHIKDGIVQNVINKKKDKIANICSELI